MKRVTLTFDNGPTPGVTERVIEMLDRHAIRAGFFVIGDKLDDPAAVELMHAAHAAGHWIGNHTLTHSVPLGESGDAGFAAREIGETQIRINSVSAPEKLFRPYGRGGRIGPHLLSRAALDFLLAGAFCTVLWNSVPGDWHDPAGWVDRCLADVAARDWTVTVLHDIAGACLAGLPDLLGRLRDLGIVFEQGFPDSVILTKGGRTVLPTSPYVSD